MNASRPNPLVRNWIVDVVPKIAGSPSRYTAPSRAPGIDPRPPITTIETTRIDTPGSNVSVLKRSVANARQTPAYPATNPDSANASNFVRTIGMPMALAAVSLSRTATSRRAIPRSRQSFTIRTDNTSTPIENHANARSDERSRPNRLGREMSVDCGSGSPVQTVLLITGSVSHGVASTASCMNNAKPSVLTARYRPRTRSAGRPTRTATTAVTAPAYGNSSGRGTLSPRWAAM